MENQEKIILITGATSGIGYAIAENLVKKGINVIGVGRDHKKCIWAEEQLAKINGNVKVHYLLADLSKRKEVYKLGKMVINYLDDVGFDSLDGLVNNAGTVPYWEILTEDGIDMQWAVNYFAGFLLSHLLIDELKKSQTARIISVSSGSHYHTRLNMKDMPVFRRYNPLFAYKRTKLAQVMFIKSFNEIYSHTGIKAFAADPGLVKTNIGFKTRSRVMKKIWEIRRRNGISPKETAKGIVFLLLASEIDDSTDIYWKHGKTKRPNILVDNKKKRDQLWDLSMQICGLKD